MRKVEAQMVQAVRYQEEWKGANTEVKVGLVNTYVELYGHCIAKIANSHDAMLICCQAQHTDGAVSATTASRLNVLLDTFARGDFSVHRHRGGTLAYYKNRTKIIDGDEWYEVPMKTWNNKLDTGETSA